MRIRERGSLPGVIPLALLACLLCLSGCPCRWAPPAQGGPYEPVRYVSSPDHDPTPKIRYHDVRDVLTDSRPEALLHVLRNDILSALPWDAPDHGYALEVHDSILIGRLPIKAHDVVGKFLADQRAAQGPFPPLPMPLPGQPPPPKVVMPEK